MFNGEGSTGPAVIYGGLNLANVTGYETRAYTVTFATPMPDATYSVVGTSSNTLIKVPESNKT